LIKNWINEKVKERYPVTEKEMKCKTLRERMSYLRMLYRDRLHEQATKENIFETGIAIKPEV